MKYNYHLLTGLVFTSDAELSPDGQGNITGNGLIQGIGSVTNFTFNTEDLIATWNTGNTQVLDNQWV